MKPKAALRHFLALAGSSLLAVTSVSAATRNWEGDVDALWATAGNWDTAPANSLLTDIANFNLATYGGNPVFAPNAGTTSINGITIGALNGAMTLTTTNLSIGDGGISIANGAGAFTISGTTTLGAAQNWTNNSGSLFTFGAVTNAANLLTIGGSGNTTASGIIGNGAGGLTKEGAGLLTLNAANTYTGATTVNGGELRWGITNAIAGGALNINNGGTVNLQTFTDTVGTVTIANGGSITGTSGTLTTSSFISNGGGTMTGTTLQLGSTTAGITYNGGVGSTTLQIDKVTVNDGTSTHEFNIADGDAAVDFDITGAVNNSGNNVTRTIVKTGAGVMQFSGSTLGSAGQNGIALNINEGTVLMNRATGIAFAPGGNSAITVGDGTGSAGSAILKFAATGGDNQLGNRAITINSDGLFDLNGKTQTGTGALNLNSTGQLDFNGGTLSVGAVTIVGTGAGANTTPIKNTAGTGGLTVASLAITPTAGYTTTLSLGASGTLTLGGDVTLNAAGTGRAQITGSALSMGAANRIFNIGLGSGADYDLLVGAGISASGARSLTKNGIGRLVLTGSNSYSGGTTINAGTLQIGDGTTAGTMASTGALTMGNATFRVLAPASGGSSQTVASLATTASTGSTIRLTPGSTGNTTLTITSGTLSTGAGSSLNFDYSAGTTVGGTVGNNSVVWSPTLTAGIIGGAYTVTDSGGTGFATRNGSNIVRLTDPGSAGLPVSTGSATGSYFVNSSYSTDTTTTPGSLVQALSGAVAASNVTVNTTGLASGANLALGTNLLTLGAGMVFDGPNAYEISGSGAGGLKAASNGGTINLYNANTNTVTISAPIVDTTVSRLTVDGPGTTILSGTNTYTGATVVNGGTVRFSGTMAASPITINNGAVAQLGTATSLTSSNTVTFGAGSTGSLQLLGNNLTIGALNSNATTLGTPMITNNNGGGAVANATLTIDSGAGSTFGGVIQDGTGGGTLSLVKAGLGTLTLTGSNSYTGTTSVVGGTLNVNASSVAAIGNGTLSLSGNGQLFLTATNLSSSSGIDIGTGGGQLRVAKNNNMAFSGNLTGSGNLTFVDAGGSGGVPIYSFNSTSNSFSGGMVLNLADVRVNGLADTSANNIVYNIAGSTFALNTGATSNLVLNNRAIELANVSGTLSNLSTTHAITIGSNLVASGAGAKVLTLSAVAGPTNAFSGNISDGSGGGTVGITTSGSGTWVLGNSANSYTGTTTIGTNTAGGTLMINTLKNYGVASSLGAPTSGDIIFFKQAVNNLVYVGSGDTTNRTIRHEADVSNRNNNSGIYNNGTGALIFNGSTFNTPFVASGNAGRTTVFNLGGTFAGDANEIRGVIANNDATSLIAITKNGSGTWTLGGSNTYTGATTLNAGTLKLNYDTGTLGTNTSKLADTNGILALNGGTLELAGGSHAEVVTSTTLNNGTTFIKQTGGGSSTLSMGAITYTGGALDFSAAGIANVSTSTVTSGILSSAAGTARVTVGGADWAAKDGSNNVIAYSGYTSFTGGATSANTNYSSVGDVTLGANRGATSNTFKITTSGSGQSMKLNSNFNLTLGSLLFAGADNYSIAAESGTGRIDSAFLLHNYGAGTLTLGATNGAITQFGTGTTILSGNNAADVGINIFGGTVQFSNNLQIGTNATAKAIALNNGTLRANTGGGDIALNSSGTLSHTVTLGAGGGTLDVIGGNKLTVSGVISDTAGQLPTLTIGSGSSDGTIELTGTNTYTGTTLISGGTLSVGTIGNGGVAGNLGQASSAAFNIVFDGGTLAHTGASEVSNRAFTINAGKTATIHTTNNLSLVGATGPATTGALTKTGAGTLTLTGASTYTGGTTVSAGKLLVNNTTGSGTGTGTVSVGASGTLGGTGIISGGVNVTGQLSPGASIETLATGTLSMANDSTLVHELDSFVADTVGSDLLKVTGDLNLSGTVNLTLDDLAVTDVAFAVNDTFSLINYTGSWNNGLLTFGSELLSDEEVFSFGLNTWKISYDDAEGGLNYTGEYAGGTDSFVNLVAVTIIPEPGTALLGGLGVLLMFRRRR